MLQCPTCSAQMVPPLIHCSEGHHYCNNCILVNTHCRECQLPMRSRRNYAFESLCFSYSLKCSFAPDGCLFTGTCIVVAEHERCCEFSRTQQRHSVTLSERVRPIEDSRGQSLEEALLAELECPVCLSLILPPIVECSNGHRICHECYQRVEHCPICRIPMAYTINLILGDIFEMMVVSCKHARVGCEFRDNVRSVMDHEKSCKFIVKLCPLTVDGICKWKGAMRHLVEHCENAHSDRLILANEYRCINGNFEHQLSNHNLFYINGVLFRFGWYACDGFYKFSVNSFGYVGNEVQYSYQIKVFHRTGKYLVTKSKMSCADLEDGDIKFLNRYFIEMPQGLDCFNELGEITYEVKMIEHRM
nr:E3 ubiquitin-protein ligase SINAT4-like [Leptinotarsa decemlineata]